MMAGCCTAARCRECARRQRSWLGRWAIVAAVGLCASGCVTTPDWSQESLGSRIVARKPAEPASGSDTVPPAQGAVQAPRPRLDDFRYVDDLTLPRTPEIWIHRPEPAAASWARQTDAETSRRLGASDLPVTGRLAALLERARARETLWRLHDALADLDAALQLQPGDIEVELERAWLLGALSRTGESVALMPDLFRSQESARVLGLIRFQEGRFDAAAAALEFYIENPSASANLRLLQVVAEARATGKPLKSWVLDALTTGPAVQWPGPIAGYLLGRIEPAKLLDAAAMAPVFPSAAAICQAWFFVGQNELLRGDRDAAARALLAAVHTRATSAVEYRLATAELIHLGVLAANSLPGTPAW